MNVPGSFLLSIMMAEMRVHVKFTQYDLLENRSSVIADGNGILAGSRLMYLEKENPSAKNEILFEEGRIVLKRMAENALNMGFKTYEYVMTGCVISCHGGKGAMGLAAIIWALQAFSSRLSSIFFTSDKYSLLSVFNSCLSYMHFAQLGVSFIIVCHLITI